MTEDATAAATSLDTFNRLLGPRSAFDAAAALEFIAGNVIPLRVATLDQQGYPHVTSLWFLLDNGRFVCCSRPGSVLCRNLRRDPRAGFELAVNHPPYRGLSGRAEARFLAVDAGPILHALADRYLGERDARLRRWLLARAATEAVLALEPRRMTSWDFSKRMSPAERPAPSGP